jgi:hypothetical protein
LEKVIVVAASEKEYWTSLVLPVRRMRTPGLNNFWALSYQWDSE